MPPRPHIQHPVALPELDGNMRVLIGVIPIFFLPISVRKTRDENRSDGSIVSQTSSRRTLLRSSSGTLVPTFLIRD